MDEFRNLLQQFIRQFGLLSETRTPCDKPITTSHAHALMTLRSVNGGGVAQAALVERLGLDKSSVSRLVSRMVDLGHAEPAVADADGRARPIRLTRKGARLADEVDRASRARFDALLGHVEPTQRRDVVAALRHLVAAVGRMTHAEEARS